MANYYFYKPRSKKKMKKKSDNSISWEFIYAEWTKGATYEQLEKTFSVDAKAIERHATEYGWKAIVKESKPIASLIEQKKRQIEQSRAIALKNCDGIQTIVDDALEKLTTNVIKDNDLKAQQNQMSILYTIAKIVDISHTVRSAATGDKDGRKDSELAKASTTINVLLPQIMSKPRMEITQNDIIDIPPMPTLTVPFKKEEREDI